MRLARAFPLTPASPRSPLRWSYFNRTRVPAGGRVYADFIWTETHQVGRETLTFKDAVLGGKKDVNSFNLSKHYELERGLSFGVSLTLILSTTAWLWYKCTLWCKWYKCDIYLAIYTIYGHICKLCLSSLLCSVQGTRERLVPLSYFIVHAFVWLMWARDSRHCA